MAAALVLCLAIGWGIYLLIVQTTARTEVCTTYNTINASVSVVRDRYTVIGLNVDTESLTFGKVSPGSVITRTVAIDHSRDSRATLSANGVMAPWLSIEPSELRLTANIPQQVRFAIAGGHRILGEDLDRLFEFMLG